MTNATEHAPLPSVVRSRRYQAELRLLAAQVPNGIDDADYAAEIERLAVEFDRDPDTVRSEVDERIDIDRELEAGCE